MTCTCGNPSDGWPHDMCQRCWEAYCDKAWWDAATGATVDPELDAMYEAAVRNARDPHDDHDPAWHGNLASIRNADIPRGEGSHTND
jgi:hypothetical protein